MKILSLNCQKGHNINIESYLHSIIKDKTYDFILLQEAELKVVSIVNEITKESHYKFITHEEKLSKLREVGLFIIYKTKFNLEEKIYFPYKKLTVSPYLTRGSLIGVFGNNNFPKVIISVNHLIPGFNSKTRIENLKSLKEYLIKSFGSNSLRIVAGDFNAIENNEYLNHQKILEPEFTNTYQDNTPTYDSRFIEVRDPISFCVKAASYIGIRKRLKLDYFYIDKKSYDQFSITCKILDIHVSDHLPLELNIN